jgi:hypothetical protein
MFETDIYKEKLSGFCEAKIYGEHPEYLNSFTSIIMTWVGLIGIYNNIHTCQNIYMLHSALLINGFCSFVYHWTAQYGWGVFDTVTIAFIVLFGGISLIEKLRIVYNIGYRNILVNILPTLYFTLMIVPSCVKNDVLFRKFLGLFIVLIVISFIMIHHRIHHLEDLNHSILHNGYKGIAYVAIGGVSAALSEIFCDSHPFIKYIPGHPLWHLFISYGTYHVAQFITVLHIIRIGNKYEYDDKSSKIRTYFPTITEYYYDEFYKCHVKIT